MNHFSLKFSNELFSTNRYFIFPIFKFITLSTLLTAQVLCFSFKADTFFYIFSLASKSFCLTYITFYHIKFLLNTINNITFPTIDSVFFLFEE